MKDYNNHIALSLLFALVFCSSTYANFSFFDDSDIQTLHFVSETHEVYKKDGELIFFQDPEGSIQRGGESILWRSVYFDLAGERLASTYVYSNEKPIPFSNPDGIRLFVDKTYYDIAHPLKRVLINQIDFRQVTSYFSLYGWFYDGINLTKTIKTLTDTQLQDHEDGTKSFKLDYPKTNQPAECFIDDQNRVVKIQTYDKNYKPGDESKPVSVDTLIWAKVSNTSFWYPKTIRSNVVTSGGVIIDSEITIHDISINPRIPIGTFNTNYPEDYQQKDRRRLLKRPNF